MSTIKNLNVNRNATYFKERKKRKTKLKLIIGAIAMSVIIIAAPIATNIHNENVKQEQITTISTYYDEDSTESKIMKYIDISEKLNKLKLDEYKVNDNVFKSYNISSELKTPKEIEKLITKFNEYKSFDFKKNLTKQCESIDIILTLINQEKLVNSYIYEVGYSTANTNATNATKKYVGEVFGIENEEELILKYNNDIKSGETSVLISKPIENEYGLRDTLAYSFDNYFQTEEEKNINDGVSAMVNTNTKGDKDFSDNDQYNKSRNDNIINALAESAELETQVAEYDLYNEKMATKLK